MDTWVNSYISPIVNNAAMNIGVQISAEVPVFIWGKYTLEWNCWIVLI